MFFVLSKTLDVAFSPLCWGLALSVWSYFLWQREDRQRTARVAAVVGLLAITVPSLPLTEGALVSALERSATDTRRPGVRYDAVVVLGGMFRSPAPGEPLILADGADRLALAFDVLSREEARFAILSGGAPLGGEAEARAMQRQLLAWGIAPDRLLLEERSFNTRQNALFTRELADERGLGSLLIVTSAFHMLRAEECFAAVGLTVDTLPADRRAHPGTGLGLRPSGDSLAGSEAMLRELGGRVVYRTLGYAKPTPR